MIGRENEVRQYRERAGRLGWSVFVAFAVLVARLFYLQAMHGEELRFFSEKNHLKRDTLFAARGRILDRNQRVLVDSRAAFDITVLLQDYDPDRAGDLAAQVGLRPEDLREKIRQARHAASFLPVVLRDDVDRDQIARLEMDMNRLPGISVEARIRRRYPLLSLSAQILGYIGEADPAHLATRKLASGDTLGESGIERQYDERLRGTNGTGYIEVDASGDRHPLDGQLFGYATAMAPRPGTDLQLTIDADLSAVAARALADAQMKGSVVVLDARNGEVLAMVNDPTFDPDALSARATRRALWPQLVRDASRPLRNRAVQDIYPPGSIFKPFVALAALNAQVVRPGESFDCGGGLRFGKRLFHCHRTHGIVDLFSGLQKSCDVYFYQLGLRAGVDAISGVAHAFGLGERSGIDLPGEQRGVVPSQAWKRAVFHDDWHDGETLSVAIGQGAVAVTPLQMAAAYAALGNGGTLFRPHIVQRIGDGEPIVPSIHRQIAIAPEILRAVREGLFRVVNAPGGTAYRWRSALVTIAGKTGTAQVRQFAHMAELNCDALPYADRHHSWFAGYAPAESPQIAIAVVAEHGCHNKAPPIAKTVIEAYFKTHAPAAAR